MSTSMTSMPTASLGLSNAKGELPPLAFYKSVQDYSPSYGDYFIWSKWFSTWHGVVTHWDLESGTLSIVFAGLPFLLLTMDEAEQAKETKILKISDIKNAKNGKFAIQQQDRESGQSVWYI